MCFQDLVCHWLAIIVGVQAYWLPILVTNHAYSFHDSIHLMLYQALKPDMLECHVPWSLPKSSAMTFCGVQKSCWTVPWQPCKCHCGHPCHAQSQCAKASWLPIKPLWHPMLHFNTMVKYFFLMTPTYTWPCMMLLHLYIHKTFVHKPFEHTWKQKQKPCVSYMFACCQCFYCLEAIEKPKACLWPPIGAFFSKQTSHGSQQGFHENHEGHEESHHEVNEGHEECHHGGHEGQQCHEETSCCPRRTRTRAPSGMEHGAPLHQPRLWLMGVPKEGWLPCLLHHLRATLDPEFQPGGVHAMEGPSQKPNG